jgi:hypothetical protein
MNSRELVRRDKTDLILGRTLKSWVERSPLPESRREELVRTAGSHTRIHPRWLLFRALIRVLIMSLTSSLTGRTPRKDMMVYLGTADFPYVSYGSQNHVSMLQLSILYLTPPRLGVSSFIL